MTRDEFFDIWAPLVDRHPQHFTPDVSDEVFKIFKFTEAKDAIKVVAKLMLQSRYAPVESDIREAIRLIKNQDRNNNVLDLNGQRSFRSIFSEEERKELWRTVKDVACRKISKEESKHMADSIQNIIDERRQCKACEEGFIFANHKDEPSGEYVFLCSCILGLRRIENFPRWNGKYEFNFVIEGAKSDLLAK